MENSNSGDSFAKIVRGVPDVERLLTRIHAGSCKVKDFLKVMDVSTSSLEGLWTNANGGEQTFRTLNAKLVGLEKEMTLKSASLPKLFRSVPDLSSLVEAIEDLYEVENGESFVCCWRAGSYD